MPTIIGFIAACCAVAAVADAVEDDAAEALEDTEARVFGFR